MKVLEIFKEALNKVDNHCCHHGPILSIWYSKSWLIAKRDAYGFSAKSRSYIQTIAKDKRQ